MRILARLPGISARVRVPITRLMASPLRFCASKLTQPDPKKEEPESSRFRNRWYDNGDHLELAAECLDNLAKRSCYYYEFDYDDPVAGPHIRDVLKAKNGIEGRDWEYATYEEDGFSNLEPGDDVWVEKGDRIAFSSLPGWFRDEEWAFLEEMLSYVEANDRSKVNPDNLTRLSRLAVRTF